MTAQYGVVPWSMNGAAASGLTMTHKQPTWLSALVVVVTAQMAAIGCFDPSSKGGTAFAMRPSPSARRGVLVEGLHARVCRGPPLGGNVDVHFSAGSIRSIATVGAQTTVPVLLPFGLHRVILKLSGSRWCTGPGDVGSITVARAHSRHIVAQEPVTPSCVRVCGVRPRMMMGRAHTAPARQ